MFRIAIVEDEILVKKGLLLTTDWESFECEVVGDASNGYEGVELISRVKPDIVITDIRMPGLDGLQMIQVLSGKVDTEYIIISGYSEFEYARQAVKYGVVDYLIKPINDDELNNAIRKACSAVKNKKKISKIETCTEGNMDSRITLFKEYIFEDTKTSKSYFVEKMIKYIYDNYWNDISIKDVADKLNMSESHVSRLFKSEVGHTFIDYLTYYRVKKAVCYLKDPDVRIYEIADKIGYKDQRYFSMIFKKYVGITPKEFREKFNR